MPTFLDYLRQYRQRRASQSSAPLAAKLDKQFALIESLADDVRRQSRQIKQLSDTLKDQDQRWRSIVDRMTAERAYDSRESVAGRRRQDLTWRLALDNQTDRQKREAKWRATFARQLGAVVRHLMLPRDLPTPFNLAARRFQLRSQFEEDGILFALLEQVGVVGRRFVEIGCGRSGGNSAALALDCGWEGLMIDASAPAIDSLRGRLAMNPAVTAVVATVLPENINDLLTGHGYAGEVDMLSLDIDSYDYWVLEALQVCRPRVLIAEYNAAFGGQRAVTIPYPQPLAGTPKGYHGASLAAMVAAARRKDYRLVLCDESGVNAFFVRNDLAPALPELPVARAFKPALSRIDPGQEVPDRGIYRLAAERGLSLVDV